MPDSREILRRGYLTKSPPDATGTFNFRQWRRRWFVLCDSALCYPLARRSVRLEYFDNEDTANRLGEPKGIIDLRECIRVVKADRGIKGHKFVFDVVTDHRRYHLSADSAAERNEWVDLLHAVTADDFKAREYRDYMRQSKIYLDDPGPAGTVHMSQHSSQVSANTRHQPVAEHAVARQQSTLPQPPSTSEGPSQAFANPSAKAHPLYSTVNKPSRELMKQRKSAPALFSPTSENTKGQSNDSGQEGPYEYAGAVKNYPTNSGQEGPYEYAGAVKNYPTMDAKAPNRITTMKKSDSLPGSLQMALTPLRFGEGPLDDDNLFEEGSNFKDHSGDKGSRENSLESAAHAYKNLGPSDFNHIPDGAQPYLNLGLGDFNDAPAGMRPYQNFRPSDFSHISIAPAQLHTYATDLPAEESQTGLHPVLPYVNMAPGDFPLTDSSQASVNGYQTVPRRDQQRSSARNPYDEVDPFPRNASDNATRSSSGDALTSEYDHVTHDAFLRAQQPDGPDEPGYYRVEHFDHDPQTGKGTRRKQSREENGQLGQSVIPGRAQSGTYDEAVTTYASISHSVTTDSDRPVASPAVLQSRGHQQRHDLPKLHISSATDGEYTYTHLAAPASPHRSRPSSSRSAPASPTHLTSPNSPHITGVKPSPSPKYSRRQVSSPQGTATALKKRSSNPDYKRRLSDPFVLDAGLSLHVAAAAEASHWQAIGTQHITAEWQPQKGRKASQALASELNTKLRISAGRSVPDLRFQGLYDTPS